MPTKDLHASPFQESTLVKLAIFEDYAQAWIPTFVMSNYAEIRIFDFFAGQGFDMNGVPGSSIRVLEKIKEQSANAILRKVKIRLFLNEYKKNKLDLLRSACSKFLEDNPQVNAIVQIVYENKDFDQIFLDWLRMIGAVPSLVYLDQNGIKAIAPKYFQELARRNQTDFLYFVSSSYFARFGNHEAFKTHFQVDRELIRKSSYFSIHRQVLAQLKAHLPPDTNVRLYPFTLKKDSNIHGLVFGASHPRAVDKFLRIVWKQSPTNGEANFDIDDDRSKQQPDLWGHKSPTKLERFADELRQSVLSGQIVSNRDALDFAYGHGHLPSHAKDVLLNMKKTGEIDFDGSSPLVTYEKVYGSARDRRIIEYRIIENVSKQN